MSPRDLEQTAEEILNSLKSLQVSGQLERVKLVAEMPHVVGEISAEELVKLCAILRAKLEGGRRIVVEFEANHGASNE